MRRTRAPNNSASLPAVTGSATPGYHTDGPPGTIVSAAELNIHQEEIVAVATMKGAALDDTGANRHQMKDAVDAVLGVEAKGAEATGVDTIRTLVVIASNDATVGEDTGGVVNAVVMASDTGSAKGFQTAVIASSDSRAGKTDGSTFNAAVIAASGGVAEGAQAAVIASGGDSLVYGSACAALASYDATIDAASGISAAIASEGVSVVAGTHAAAVAVFGGTIGGNESAIVAGNSGTVSGDGSAVIGGNGNTVNGDSSVALGGAGNTVEADDSAILASNSSSIVPSFATSAIIASNAGHIEGTQAAVIASDSSEADGTNSVCVGTTNCVALGAQSAVMAGSLSEANATASAVIGSTYSKATSGINNVVILASRGYESADPDGGGAHTAAPAFSVAMGYNAGTPPTPGARTIALEANGGNIRSTNASVTTGLDYAEWFPNVEGKAHPPGRFLALEGAGVRLARPGDPIAGGVSVAPTVVGGDDSLGWHGRYARDEYGAFIWDDVELVDEVVTDEARRAHSDAVRAAREKVRTLGAALRIAKVARADAAKAHEVAATDEERTRAAVDLDAAGQALAASIDAHISAQLALDAIPEPARTTIKTKTRAMRVSAEIDYSKKHTPRSGRPAEHTCVGLTGQLPFEVDATVVPGCLVMPAADGRGTKATPEYLRSRVEDPGAVARCMAITTPFDQARGFAIVRCLLR